MDLLFLHSQLRAEEKLLLNELSRQSIDIQKIDVRSYQFRINSSSELTADMAFDRSISSTHGLNAIRYFENYNINTMNNSSVISICNDKLHTSLVLARKRILQPEVAFAQSEKAAIELIEDMTYPVVIKPVVGSWGRLLSKINDREAAEAIIEHRTRLGYTHSTHYIQEYIDKKGRDIRTFVVGDQCIAGIYRNSDHWISNTARGGKASNCKITDEIAEISLSAVGAITNGKMDAVLAVDIMGSNGQLLVNEINATMEFKNSIQTTGVNIPERIISFLIDHVRN